MLNEDDLRPGDVLQDKDGDFWHVHEDGKLWCSEPENRVSFGHAEMFGPFTYAPGCDPKRDTVQASKDDSVKHESKRTRADLPSVGKIREADDMAGNGLRSRVIDIAPNEVVEHLNAHYPKPEPDKWRVEWVAVSEDLKAARQREDLADEQWKKWEDNANEWKARAEAAEKRHQWPKTTPSGHTYVEPRTYEALRHEHGNAAQAAIESWEADEHPPEPTWEMVGIAHREVERIRCERDEARKALEDERIVNESMTTSLFEVSRQRDDAVIGRDEWKARAEALEAEAEEAFEQGATWHKEQSVPAVSRAEQLEKNLAKVMSDYQDLEDEREEIADQFATFRAEIVAEAVKARESAVPRTDIEEQLRIAYESGNHPIERIRIATDAMCDLFSVEAEQDVDPIEEKARELYRAATPDARWETVADEYRRIAAHVLGQEADQ